MGYDLKIGEEVFNGIEKIRVFDVDDQLRTFSLFAEGTVATGSTCQCGFIKPNEDLDIKVDNLGFTPTGVVIIATNGHRDDSGAFDIAGDAVDNCGALIYSAYVPDKGIRLRAIDKDESTRLTIRLNAGDNASLFKLESNSFTLEASGTNVYKPIADMEYFWIAWG